MKFNLSATQACLKLFQVEGNLRHDLCIYHDCFCLQDALFFLKDFFTSLAAEVELFSPPDQEGKSTVQYSSLDGEDYS